MLGQSDTLGKIAVIKSLGVSKITYLTMNIPDPTEGFGKNGAGKNVVRFFVEWQERSNKTKDALSSF